MHYQLSIRERHDGAAQPNNSTHPQSHIGTANKSGGHLTEHERQGQELLDPRFQAARTALHPMVLHVDAEA